jgi:hypothetical protein
MAKCIEELEQDMELLGVTGVEGMLVLFLMAFDRQALR